LASRISVRASLTQTDRELQTASEWSLTGICVPRGRLRGGERVAAEGSADGLELAQKGSFIIENRTRLACNVEMQSKGRFCCVATSNQVRQSRGVALETQDFSRNFLQPPVVRENLREHLRFLTAKRTNLAAVQSRPLLGLQSRQDALGIEKGGGYFRRRSTWTHRILEDMKSDRQGSWCVLGLGLFAKAVCLLALRARSG
jgi:hypothetical protein